MLGRGTLLVALGLAVTMLVVTLLVHLAGGFFMPIGIEFTLTLFGASLALAFAGAGARPLGALIARRRKRLSSPHPAPSRVDPAA